MFNKPTVFILGAGASWHYGYPTGEDLVREIRLKAEALAAYLKTAQHYGAAPEFMADWYGTPANNLALEHWEKAQTLIADLIRRIKGVDPFVIDYFLGHNQGVANLGRLLIAWVLLEREASSNRSGGENVNWRTLEERQTNKDNWCRFVLHRLSSGCVEPEDLIENQVTFVTFNYDLSLEERLQVGLRETELFNTTRDRFFTEERFCHVYGKIRQSGERTKPADESEIKTRISRAGYDDPNEAVRIFTQRDIIDRAFHASKGIRIIDPTDKHTEEDEQARARNAIYRAEYIYILGFGFDPNNCSRLELPTGLRPNKVQKTKRVMFTNLRDINRVNKSAAKTFCVQANALGPGMFLSPGDGDSVYEKSVRDCYGALCFDFDEEENY